MATLVPRKPYSQDELDKLYPKDLELRLVQVLLRHGERAPVSARFQNVGISQNLWSQTDILKGGPRALLAILQLSTADAERCNDT
jgi:hypothetical protein